MWRSQLRKHTGLPFTPAFTERSRLLTSTGRRFTTAFTERSQLWTSTGRQFTTAFTERSRPMWRLRLWKHTVLPFTTAHGSEAHCASIHYRSRIASLPGAGAAIRDHITKERIATDAHPVRVFAMTLLRKQQSLPPYGDDQRLLTDDRGRGGVCRRCG